MDSTKSARRAGYSNESRAVALSVIQLKQDAGEEALAVVL
jgi:phage terminase small subunit